MSSQGQADAAADPIGSAAGNVGRMPSKPVTASRRVTYLGLAVALFGIEVPLRLLDLFLGHSESFLHALLGDLSCFALLAFLLWLVVRREKLPLSSIGWNTRVVWKSLLWGVVGFLVCMFGWGLCVFGDSLLGLKLQYPTSELSLWLLMLTVIRAGVVEEVFYRGYAMERIKQLTGSTALAWVVPLGLFTAWHFPLGSAGMLNAGILGAILTGFYWWRRDLMANMISHCLVDFLPLVLFQWLAR